MINRDKHLKVFSRGKDDILPLCAEVPDFGEDTNAKNMYWMAQLLPPFMEIYLILQEVKSQYPSSEAGR